MKVWILLPAFNEERSIKILLPKISKEFQNIDLDFQICVVDDGSGDSTADILRKLRNEYPVDIVTHKINRGLGETERDGFEYIAEFADDEDILVRMDCDDTHEPEYISTMIEKLDSGFDVVNTSRFRSGGGQRGVSPYRSFVSYFANIFMKIVFNVQGVRDYSCGFRAYRIKVVKDAIQIFGNGFLQLKGLGFTSTLETLIKLNLLGCRFAEVPFILRYDKKASPSKMVSSITTLGYFTMAILYHWPFGGWRSFYKDLATTYRSSPVSAYQKYGKMNVRRSTVSQIGG